MSGLSEIGEMPGFAFGGAQVQQRDIDEYYLVDVAHPSTDNAWFGSVSGTTTGSITRSNAIADWPRNIQYSVTGIANGTYGGTFTTNLLDQFGSAVQEQVVIGTAVNGGTTYGTVVAAKFVSGTFGTIASAGTFIGTAKIGFGTVANGSATSNWFGLLSRIGGTSDVKNIRWINNGTPTTLNAGTNIGTLVNATTATLPQHAFQGTSGVALTDKYLVITNPQGDNAGKGRMANL